MSFVNPLFLWGFLSLIPLAAIYFLKVRPVKKPTNALFLWDDILQEKKSSALFRRLRDLFSLLILILAFSAIILALAGPDFSGADRKDLVLLIDNSASMNAIDGTSTRLAKAKKMASQIVQALNGNQRCSIVSISNETSYVSNMSNNPRELLDAIDKIQPSTTISDFSNLDKFVSTDAESGTEKASGKKTNHRVILISDGCTSQPIPQEIEVIKIGEFRPGNIGIVAADIQRLPGKRAGVFFQVASSYPEPVEADLIINFQESNNLVKIVPLTIQSGLNPPDTFEIENAESGSWFARLEINEKKRRARRRQHRIFDVASPTSNSCFRFNQRSFLLREQRSCFFA